MQDSKKEKPSCTHFAAGKCTRGDKCRFKHDKADGGFTKRSRKGAQARRIELEANKDSVEGIVPMKIGEAPLCKGHKEPCIKRRVTKKNSANYGREYFRCSHSGEAGREKCGFFVWAENAKAGELPVKSKTRGGRKKRKEFTNGSSNGVLDKKQKVSKTT